MSKHLMRLLRLQMSNLFGINELLHTKDRGKKKRFLGLAFVQIMLILMLMGYVAGFSYGFIHLGMAEIVPMYLYTVVSLLILFLTFFKAGSTLFSMKGYEMLVSLPVSRTDIVFSRFACMYLTNFLAGCMIMLPGIAVYGYFIRPGIFFYLICFISTLFLPLLPLTLASVVGAMITAVSARTKHKSIGETVLMLVFIVAVMVGSMMMSGQAEQMNVELLKNMAGVLTEQIGKIYPPALWFKAALAGDMVAFLLLLILPMAIFAVFLTVLQKYFQSICTALNAVTVKNNYKMENLQASGIVTALWKKELKRYFASSVYVTNTIVGYVLAALAALALFFMGVRGLGEAMEIPGLELVLGRCIPFGVACFMSITTMTSCSISMEGKSFWQIQTLPVHSKAVYDSKILANLTVAAPFYVLTVILICLAIRPTLLDAIWIVLIPACYLLFTATAGITVNLLFPVLNWESEVRVVKQSASTMVMMLIGMVSSILPLAAIIVLRNVSVHLLNTAFAVLLLAVTGILYTRNNRKELML